MGLVDYQSSDSEQEQPKPAAPPKKQPFEKLVDKSNPGKIRVNLTQDSTTSSKENGIDGSEPPAKRAKTGGFGGFNSLLPAPKRAAGTAPGLRKGVNLKTGAEPAFTREPMAAPPINDDVEQERNTPKSLELGPGPAVSAEENSTAKSDPQSTASAEAIPKKKATIFKPLSVARKPQKKKPTTAEGPGLGTSTGEARTKAPEPTPKLSLFSVSNIDEPTESLSNSTGTYQPLVYQRNDESSGLLDPTTQPTLDNPSNNETLTPGGISAGPNHAGSLDEIAADLNLSASARRQLLGRNQRDGRATSIKITNFNTDQEYAANEVLRQSGEIVQHNAVRGIAPGKHSLKQLVNAATNQKDALEEQFAAGRRNKSEAGAKYGW